MAGPVLHPTDGEVLVRLAADAVRARLHGDAADGRIPRSAALRRLGCSFVTLYCSGALRGCIGSLDPRRPLYRDVAQNAVLAMADPRMEPLRALEWPIVTVSVSVLGRAEPVAARKLTDLHRMLRPHLDGLVLTAGRRQATFLPAVWEKLPDPRDFVAALLEKGGWARDRLPPGVQVYRYTAEEFPLRR